MARLNQYLWKIKYELGKGGDNRSCRVKSQDNYGEISSENRYFSVLYTLAFQMDRYKISLNFGPILNTNI